MFRFFCTALKTELATSEGCAVSFTGNSIFSVILVYTKPGRTVITCTLFLESRLRKPDKNAVSPALAEP